MRMNKFTRAFSHLATTKADNVTALDAMDGGGWLGGGPVVLIPTSAVQRQLSTAWRYMVNIEEDGTCKFRIAAVSDRRVATCAPVDPKFREGNSPLITCVDSFINAMGYANKPGAQPLLYETGESEIESIYRIETGTLCDAIMQPNADGFYCASLLFILLDDHHIAAPVLVDGTNRSDGDVFHLGDTGRRALYVGDIQVHKTAEPGKVEILYCTIHEQEEQGTTFDVSRDSMERPGGYPSPEEVTKRVSLAADMLRTLIATIGPQVADKREPIVGDPTMPQSPNEVLHAFQTISDAYSEVMKLSPGLPRTLQIEDVLDRSGELARHARLKIEALNKEYENVKAANAGGEVSTRTH